LDEARLDWLKLKLVPRLGSQLYERLLRCFGSPGAALRAGIKQLQRVKGLSHEVAGNIAGEKYLPDLDSHIEALERLRARMLIIEDPDYPPFLRHIYNPPPILFVQGQLKSAPAVAVVGSRRPSRYGQQVARELGKELGRKGISVVSGLARGIDAMAHQGALSAGGYSMGVLACSLDYIYPKENAALIEEMKEKGAVLSEFLIKTPPQPGLFPVRNRIISGLSQAVVVVEASLRSGSLITARHALEQGREIFAVPGPVNNPLSQGCHELLRQGANLMASLDDLFTVLPEMNFSALPEGKFKISHPEPGLDLPATHANILNLIGMVPMHIDAVIRKSGLSSQEVAAALVELEMNGYIDQMPGRNYVKL
jgi:DNA processing protein